MVDHVKCLCDSMLRHIGQTVTIFTTSGGLSGGAVVMGLKGSPAIVCTFAQRLQGITQQRKILVLIL